MWGYNGMPPTRWFSVVCLTNWGPQDGQKQMGKHEVPIHQSWGVPRFPDIPISTEGIDKPSPILPQITPSIIVEIVDGPRMHF